MSAPATTRALAAAPQAPRVSPLAVMGQRFQIEPAKLLEVLRATCIKPDKNGRTASNEEVAAFVIVANQYGLNPFTREIHAFVGRQGAVVPIVGIDGWVKLVNREAGFDGCEFFEHADEEGKLLAMTCAMHAKDRAHPIRVTEWLSECRQNTPPWQNMPRRMLRHKAYIQAARLCFGLSGIYDEDEGQQIAHLAPAGLDPLPLNGNGGQAAAKLAPAAHEPTPPQDAPDLPDKTEIVCQISDGIRDADSQQALRDGPGVEMARQQAYLGESMYAPLLRAYQEKARALQKGQRKREPEREPGVEPDGE